MKNYIYDEAKKFCAKVAEVADYYHVNSLSDLDKEVAHWEEFSAIVELIPGAEWNDLNAARVAIYDGEGDSFVTGCSIGRCCNIDPWNILDRLIQYITKKYV